MDTQRNAFVALERTMMTLCVVALLAACGGGGGGSNGDGGGGGGSDCPSGDTVECSLDALGVDTTVTKREIRVDADTVQDLPDDYVPLGGARTIDKFTEIFGLGLELDLAGAGSNPFGLVEVVAGSNSFSNDVLSSPDAADTPWTAADHARAAAAADVDGDGRDELIVIYRDTSLANSPVELVVVEDDVDGNGISTPRQISSAAATDFDVAAGDLDGDGDFEAAVAMMFADDDGLVRLLLLDNDGGTLGRSPSGNNPIDFVRRQAALDDAMTLAVETANLDFDRAHELAVIVNEYQSPFGSNSNDSASRYVVFDDANTDFAELASGDANILGVAKGADIALGDVDGDNVAEVIWGGLSHIGSECSELAAKNANYIVVVLDDAPRDFAVMRSHTEPYDVVPQACSSGASRQLTFVHVNAADVDDDGATEIQANGLIFEDLRQDAGSGGLTVAYTIPSEQLLWEAQSGSDGTFTWKSSSMAIGDATSDKSDDVIFVTDAFNVGDVIRVWGIDPLDGAWKNLHNVPFESFSIDQRPLVVPANVNDDSLAIAYSDGSYRLVFTEPLIIAALAAAPCDPGAGQDVGDCRTAFGKGTSTSTSVETGWSVSAGTSVGFEQEFSALGVKVGGVEAVASVQSETRKFTEETYTLTKRVIHTTGPIEDSVIFTTTPLDVYTYEILSHPNPELIGGEVQVRLPREPISIMTDREFYNDTVDEGSLKIDERIFEHAEGDPFSYPTTSERNTLLSRFDGVQSDEIDVGQGTGFVTADVNIFEEVTSGESYSLDVSLDVRATGGGLVTGYSIGSGVDSAVAYGRGQESIYQGSVAQLPGSNFPDDAYRFGLFSYVYEDSGSGQEFEVVNYWVRPQL